MTFVQIGFTGSPCGQGRRGPWPLIDCSPPLTIALYFFDTVAGLVDRVVIVRVTSDPNNKADCQRYENEYNYYF